MGVILEMASGTTSDSQSTVDLSQALVNFSIELEDMTDELWLIIIF